jgi:hypothetical protein
MALAGHMHGSWTDAVANELDSKHGDVLNSVHVTGARAVLLRGVARPPGQKLGSLCVVVASRRD